MTQFNKNQLSTEKYSRGRRGAPAKGVGRETVARVQIPPSPPRETTLTPRVNVVFFIVNKKIYYMRVLWHSSLHPSLLSKY